MARSKGGRAMIRRIVAAWAIAVLLTTISLSSALAHAVVVRSEPPDGGGVARSPKEIRLWFSEPVLPQAAQARVLDMNGKAVPSTHVQVAEGDPTLLILTVPELGEGIYSVVYAALSAADSHATQGHLVFKVGAGSASGDGVASVAGPAVSPVEALLRWLNFLALAAVAGAIAVAFLLLRHGSARSGDLYMASPSHGADVTDALGVARRRVLRWAFAAALVAVGAGAALLFLQAATLALPGDTGSPANRSALEGFVWLATHTRSGFLWDARQMLLLILTPLLIVARGANPTPASLATDGSKVAKAAGPVLWLLVVTVLALQAGLGHAAAVTPDRDLAIVMDTAHLVAASLWVGGLLALAVGLLPIVLSARGKEAYVPLARAGWGPFGTLAALSVGVLIATGLYSAGRQVASPDALLTTFYGRTLILKVGLVMIVGIGGLLNSTMLHPRLSAPLARLLRRPSGWTPLSLKRLPGVIVAELAVGGLVLLVTGTLVSLSPANGAEFAPPAAATPPVTSPVQIVGDLLVTFEAKPNQPGQNIALIRAVSTRRPAPAEIMRVIVHYTFLGQDIGSVVTDAQQIAPGEYQAAGDQLSLPGQWQVEVVVRRKGVEDSRARFPWTVLAPSVTREVVVSNRPLEPIFTPLAALLLVCLAGSAVIARLGTAGLARARVRQRDEGGRITFARHDQSHH